MKISIVTPSLNQGRYIGEALDSVRAQGYPWVEHLVMDGGSNDETLALLESLDGGSEWSYVKWRSQPDGGQSHALNQGFSEATGDIIGWLNSDDRYRAGCFDHVVRAFTENPALDVLYGDFIVMDESGATLQVRREIEFSRFILLYHRVLYIPTPATFFRRRVFDEGNRLRSDLHYAMDYEFFVRLADAGYTFQHIPKVLADFRMHPGSKTCNLALEQAREKQQTMWAVSPISRWTGLPLLRRAAFFGAQCLAGLMRYSQKMMRGYYFGQLSLEEGVRETSPPTT
jgi:glycosyltransferase involved in cell wall biosynthesis